MILNYGLNILILKVREVAKTAKDEVAEGDYDLNGGKSVYELTRGDTTKGEKERKILFKDYSAHAFHHLRALFGYTPESFLV
jgi:hypothetical protein